MLQQILVASQDKQRIGIIGAICPAKFDEQLEKDIEYKYQLTIPSYYNTKLLKNKNYQFFYLKEELYEIGITEMKTPYGNKVKVYDLERTICDIIRNKKKIEIALFTDAMKRYADRKDRNSIKLHKYAKIFNIEDELRKYLEVLL